MKKFYAFAAAALCAFAANAQNGAPLYATGAGPAFDPEWAPADAAEFNWDGKEYTLELEGLTQMKISTANGDWDTFNAGVYGCNYGSEPGVAVTLEAGYESNIEAPGKGDYTVTVAGDLSTITLTAKGTIDTSFPDVYVRGDMNGWGVEDEWKMEVIVPETVFSITVPAPIAVGETFKFADADWNKVNVGGDGEAIMVDTETEVFNGGNPANLSLDEEFEGTIYLTLDLDGSAYVVFATSDEFKPEWANPDDSAVSTIAADSNVAAKYFNLQGVEVANPENGLYIVVKGDKATKVLVK
ncbi:MAG: hypothetical protein K2M69_02925 [Muribaculaceae bacterium]|nr:hypothetical protein [Muribaculaceae bacterium]